MGVPSRNLTRSAFRVTRRPVARAENPCDSRSEDCGDVLPLECSKSGENATFEIAFRRDDLRAALELVYREYLRAGLSCMCRHQIRVTPYHTLPTTEVFVTKQRSRAVCTTTLVRDAALGLPMEASFAEETARRRRMGIRLAEVSCLAFDRDYQSHSFNRLSRIMAFTAQCAVRRNVDQLLIAVHPRHAAFYRRFLAFEPIGEENNYSAVRGKPAVAMVLDLVRLSLKNPQAHRRLFGEPFSTQSLRYKPISPELQQELHRLAHNCAAYNCAFPEQLPACA